MNSAIAISEAHLISVQMHWQNVTAEDWQQRAITTLLTSMECNIMGHKDGQTTSRATTARRDRSAQPHSTCGALDLQFSAVSSTRRRRLLLLSRVSRHTNIHHHPHPSSSSSGNVWALRHCGVVTRSHNERLCWRIRVRGRAADATGVDRWRGWQSNSSLTFSEFGVGQVCVSGRGGDVACITDAKHELSSWLIRVYSSGCDSVSCLFVIIVFYCCMYHLCSFCGVCIM